jgi:hypothetical protein
VIGALNERFVSAGPDGHLLKVGRFAYAFPNRVGLRDNQFINLDAANGSTCAAAKLRENERCGAQDRLSKAHDAEVSYSTKKSLGVPRLVRDGAC